MSERTDAGVLGPSRVRAIARAALVLIMVVFAFFYLMIASGGASFIHECNVFLCAQLHQAIFAGVGALALFVAAYRVYVRDSSAATIAFFGTLPILIVHVVLVITDPNESIFFPLSTSPPPLVSGASLLFRRR